MVHCVERMILKETMSLYSKVENTNKRKWFVNVFLKVYDLIFSPSFFKAEKDFVLQKLFLKTFHENVWLKKCF